jgi:uncharacterized protein YfdQ (DUF2303 family)
MNLDHDNIAQAIIDNLPEAHVALELEVAAGGTVNYVAVPRGHELKQIDTEGYLDNPRRAKTTASFSDADSFIAYVLAHNSGRTDVWAEFDPAAGKLGFTAVFDDHTVDSAGWRQKRAVYTPKTSHEWNIWSGKNGSQQAQADFALFLENNEKDVAGGDGSGFPSSLDILTMATNFEAHADKSYKSKLNLQSGGVTLEFVDTDKPETVERMKVFNKFQIGIPVFWALHKADEPVPAWPIVARLKYRPSNGKVVFWYELVRADVVFELAATALLDKVKEGLGDIPVRLGSCS